VDFLLFVIELFAKCYCWGATSENRLKIGVLQGDGTVSAKFSRRRGRSPPIISTRIDKRHKKNFVTDFLQAKCAILHGKRPFCVFEASPTFYDHKFTMLHAFTVTIIDNLRARYWNMSPRNERGDGNWYRCLNDFICLNTSKNEILLVSRLYLCLHR